MKNTIIVLLTVVSFQYSYSQWTGIGPNGGDISSLYSDGTNLYAGLNSLPFGVYKSTDNGTSWSPMGSIIADVYAITSSGSTIFASDYAGHGVFRTTNNGINWDIVNTGLTNSNARSLRAFGTNIYCGTESGIFKSTNNGNSWVNIYPSIFAYDVIEINSKIFTTNGQQTFVSTNGGTNWTENTDIPNVLNFFIDGQTIYGNIASSPFGVYVSTNGGANWSQQSTGLPTDTYIYGFTKLGTDIYAGVQESSVINFYKSSNNGSNWSLAGNLNNPGNYIPEGFTSSPGSLVTGFSFNGIWVSTNSGANWSEKGLQVNSITSVNSVGSNIFASDMVNGMNQSTDNGLTWFVNSGWTYNTPASITVFGTNILAVSLVTKKIYKTTNSGTSWQSVFTCPSGYITSLHVSGANIFAVCPSDQIYLSTNGGDTWSAKGLPNNNIIGLADIGSVTYGVTNEFIFPDYFGRIYYTSNSGTNWSSFPYDSMLTYSTSIVSLGSALYVSRGQGISIVKSTNNGANWQPAIQGLTNFAVNNLYTDGTNLFAGTENGIFVSTDAGALWLAFSTGINPINGTVRVRGGFCANGGNLYAGINGVWKRPLNQVSVNNISGAVPSNFILQQNYPNPFNPSTKINFSIPKSALVKLLVYDILGREVTTLVNEQLIAGSYNTAWDASNFPSGVYFYKLTAGNFTEAKKMILIK